MSGGLREQAAAVPDRPGVYLFLDAEGKPLYVGKAGSLRDRVRSYFQQGLAVRTRLMLSRAASLDYIATDSEMEALILESNLVKEHRPGFNVRLRDDKHFPYLRVGLDQEWPAVTVVRSIERDGARYFGPYTRPQALAGTMKAVRRLFPFRTCSDRRLASGRRPCLQHDLGRCPAPCAGQVSPEDYRANLRELCLLLEGRGGHVLKRLRDRMERAAEALNFEKAAELRDQLRSVEQVVERQKMISPAGGDLDALGVAVTGEEACVQVFLIREGKLVGRENFLMTALEAGLTAIVTAFLKQHYGHAASVPPLILVPAVPPPGERRLIEEWLSVRRGARVRVARPVRGTKRGLVALAVENAGLALQEARAAERREDELTAGAVTELGAILGLDRPPARIEAFDVSGFQGREAVAAMVVFEAGRLDKDGYRRYRIQGPDRRDDYRMLQEALHRRYRRCGTLPDLVLVDGGRGQLSAAREVLEHLGLGHLPAVALAKEQEQVYVPGRAEPLPMAGDSPAHRLLRRIRDEAHRFAVSYHRRLRGRGAMRSGLDGAPGIGPARRKALLRHFGSVAAVRRASPGELARVPGLGPRLAAELYRYLHPEQD